MQISETDEFKRDFKKLKKKFKTIDRDFEVLKKAIKAEPLGDGTKHWNTITKVGEKDLAFLKVRMSCRALNMGKNFRVIYMYNGHDIELLFIEIYFKDGVKENNDKSRIDDIVERFRG
jgi:hypothetical protein